MVNIILIVISIVVFSVRMYTNREITVIAKVLMSILVSVITTLMTFIIFYIFLESILILILVSLLVVGYTLLRITNMDDYKWLNEITIRIFEQVYESLIHVISVIISVHIVMYYFIGISLFQQIILSTLFYTLITLIRYFIEKKGIYKEDIIKPYIYSLLFVIVIFVYGFITGKINNDIELLQSEDFYSVERILITSELEKIELSDIIDYSEVFQLELDYYVVTDDYIFANFLVNYGFLGKYERLVCLDRETDITSICDYSFLNDNTTIVEYEGIGFFLSASGLTSVENGKVKTHFLYSADQLIFNRYTLLYVKDDLLYYEDSYGVFEYHEQINSFAKVSGPNEYPNGGTVKSDNLQLIEIYYEDFETILKINGEILDFNHYEYIREDIILAASTLYFSGGEEIYSASFFGAYKDNDQYYIFNEETSDNKMKVIILDSDENYVETLIDPYERDIYKSYQSGFTLSISELSYTKTNQYLTIYTVEEPATAIMFLGRDTYKMGFVVLVLFAVAPIKFRMPFKVRFKKEL